MGAINTSGKKSKGLMAAVLEGLGRLSSEFQQKIEAEVSGFAPDAGAITARAQRSAVDFEFFCKTYFPHYIKAEPGQLHRYLYERLRAIGLKGEDKKGIVPILLKALPGRHKRAKGERLALAAPRGNAKSTLVSQLFVLWCIVFAKRKYPLIIMDALDQACTMLEAIKAELEFNPRLLMDYPKATGQGRVWQVGTIISAGGIKVQAFGSGKRMRGLRHGPYRPDFIVCDDIENDENVRSPEQRDKLQSWLTKTVLSLGYADDSLDVLVIGTVLHHDSVLSRLLRNKVWESRRFQSIIHWPDRMDLWDAWEAILLAEGESEALAYFERQSEAMLAGSVVSWPDMISLYQLMVKRARDGHDAFDSEQQNDPAAGADAVFNGAIQYWSELPPANELVYVGAVDPSLGKAGAGRDPSAILVGAYQKRLQTLYVVEALVRKRKPDDQISDVIRLQGAYHCAKWAVESVQFQEFYRTELIGRSIAAGIPVPATGVHPSTDKMLRIESLQPYMMRGNIRLHPSQSVLIEQLKHFPKGDHDDGPDALHMLWTLAVATAGWSMPSFGTVASGAGRFDSARMGSGHAGNAFRLL